jgi:hypothetical protein
MIQSKNSVVIELKVILYAITTLRYNRVGFNILISIECLSYVLNNVPLLFTTTLNFHPG